MKTRTKQMKGLVISWILLYVANRIINAVMPAAQQSTRSGIASYLNVGELLGTAASIVLLVLEVKILTSKVEVEEPHKLKIKHLKAIVIFVLVLNIGMALVNPAILLYIYSNSMEAFESAVFKVNLVVGAVSNILRVIICYRVLVSKAEFDVQEEAGKA